MRLRSTAPAASRSSIRRLRSLGDKEPTAGPKRSTASPYNSPTLISHYDNQPKHKRPSPRTLRHCDGWRHRLISRAIPAGHMARLIPPVMVVASRTSWVIGVTLNESLPFIYHPGKRGRVRRSSPRPLCDAVIIRLLARTMPWSARAAPGAGQLARLHLLRQVGNVSPNC